MGLPSKRRTKSSKRRRASHFAVHTASLSTCAACGSRTRPHRICMNCGAYRGHQLMKVSSKADKKLRKREKERKKEKEKTEEKLPSAP
ncbi:MAG: 50S ribosomal protein L32 [bacterium]